MLFFAAGSISEMQLRALCLLIFHPPPKHPHQREFCFALLTGLTDGAIDVCKINIELLGQKQIFYRFC